MYNNVIKFNDVVITDLGCVYWGSKHVFIIIIHNNNYNLTEVCTV